MGVSSKLKWTGIDPANPTELEALRAQEHAEAVSRARDAVAELQRLGILDAHGRRILKRLPPDMTEDSDCDMSAF